MRCSVAKTWPDPWPPCAEGQTVSLLWSLQDHKRIITAIKSRWACCTGMTFTEPNRCSALFFAAYQKERSVVRWALEQSRHRVREGPKIWIRPLWLYSTLNKLQGYNYQRIWLQELCTGSRLGQCVDKVWAYEASLDFSTKTFHPRTNWDDKYKRQGINKLRKHKHVQHFMCYDISSFPLMYCLFQRIVCLFF